MKNHAVLQQRAMSVPGPFPNKKLHEKAKRPLELEWVTFDTVESQVYCAHSICFFDWFR